MRAAHFVELSAQDKGVQASIDKIKKKLTTIGGGIRNFGLAVAGVGVVALAPLIHSVDTLTDLGKIQDVADAFGTTGRAASGLFGVLGAAGGEFKENMEGIIQFSQTVTDAVNGVGEKGAKLFDGLSVTAEEISKLPIDEQFYRVLGAIRQLPQPLQEAKLSMLGGTDSLKQWQRLLTMSESEVRDLADELSISNEELRQASDTARQYQRTVLLLGRAWQEVVLAMAPVFSQILQGLMPAVQGIRAFITNNHELVVTIAAVAAGLVVAGLAIAALGAAIMSVAGIITAVTTIIGGISAAIAFISTPVGATIAIIAALGVAVVAVGAIFTAIFWDDIMRTVNTVMTMVRVIFAESIGAFMLMWEGLVAAIKKGDLKLAFAIVVTGIQVIWFDMLLQLKSMFTGFLNWFIDRCVQVGGIAADLLGKIPGMETAAVGLKVVGNAIGESAKAIIGAADVALSAALRSQFEKAKRDLQMLVDFAKKEVPKPANVPNVSPYAMKAAIAITGQRGSFNADQARQRFAQGESFEKRQEKLQQKIEQNTKNTADGIDELNQKLVFN